MTAASEHAVATLAVVLVVEVIGVMCMISVLVAPMRTMATGVRGTRQEPVFCTSLGEMMKSWGDFSLGGQAADRGHW